MEIIIGIVVYIFTTGAVLVLARVLAGCIVSLAWLAGLLAVIYVGAESRQLEPVIFSAVGLGIVATLATFPLWHLAGMFEDEDSSKKLAKTVSELNRLVEKQGQTISDLKHQLDAYGQRAPAGGPAVSAPLIGQPGPASGDPAPAQDTNPSPVIREGVDVILTDVGLDAPGIIRIICDATGVGLAEARSMVDTVPSRVARQISHSAAEDIKKRLEANGALVQII